MTTQHPYIKSAIQIIKDDVKRSELPTAVYAKIAQLTESQLLEILNDVREPTLLEVLLLIKHFGIDLDSIFY